MILGTANLTQLKELIVSEGVVQFQENKTFNLNTVTIENEATLRTKWFTSLNVSALNMMDGSTLDLDDIAAKTVQVGTMNIWGDATVKNPKNGDPTISGAIVGHLKNDGSVSTLTFTNGSGGNNINVTSNISGSLNIVREKVDATVTLSGTNTYTGDAIARSGTLRFTGSSFGASNAYIADGGLITVSGDNGRIANDGVAVSRRGASDAQIRKASITAEKIAQSTAGTQGTVSNATLEIKAANYSIEGVALTNSLINMAEAGTLNISDVTMGATSSVTGSSSLAGQQTVRFTNTSLTLPESLSGTGQTNFAAGTSTLESAYVYDLSSTFGDVTLTGHLTLDFSALIDGLSGEYRYVAFQFGENVRLDENFSTGLTPNAYGTTELAGQVAGHVVYFETRQIPEPAGATLGLLGLGSLLMRRRRA